MIEYRFRETAKEALEELERVKSEEIISKIEDVAQTGFEHRDLRMIKDNHGEWLWRLKVDGDKTNHRIFLDYIENKIIVLDIIKREEAYKGKYGNG